MSIAIKLSTRPVSYRATRILSFQTESFHGSAFSDQTKHFRILVPILKYTFFYLHYDTQKSVCLFTLRSVCVQHCIYDIIWYYVNNVKFH